MLKRFSVTNFRNFEQPAVFELDHPSNYDFNDLVVHDGCITKGIIYGKNGSGKSNLAFALFDIILHLTDKEKAYGKYTNYLNLSGNKPIAEYAYDFVFDGVEVVYKYGKRDAKRLDYETLIIDGSEVIGYNYGTGKGYTTLKGAETLRLSSELQAGMDTLSRVKFIRNNAFLENNRINRAFVSFTSFVDHMLMIYSLDSNGYQGLNIGGESYTQGIIRHGKMKEFEDFLRSKGIDYHLVSMDRNGANELFCQFPRKTVPFNMIASAGTRSLALFYYWYIVMSKASLVFIDDYDAFYHFDLSRELVRLVRQLTDTQIFITTHNTDLLSNELLRPDAYYLIEKNEICSLDKWTDKELRRAHNLQKMYTAGEFHE